jgi:asparagine synthetase A
MSKCHSEVSSVSPARPQTPPRKQWYDKVADAILGDEEGGGIGSSNRYALICQKCFAHNGLVKESVWEDTRRQTIMEFSID